MDRFVLVFVVTCLASIMTTAGILIIGRFSCWGKRNSTYFIAFAAGILISVSFIHLIPESIEMNIKAPYYLLLGFFVFYVFNRFITTYLCQKMEKELNLLGVIPVIGIAVHSFVDGIIYSVTFSVSSFTGVLTAVGMVLHEFPEGVVTYLLLLKAGFSKRKSVIFAFLAAGFTTPLGMLLSWPFINELTSNVLGALLSFSAGALVYVGATHLLPEVEQEDRQFSIFALFAGVVTAGFIVMMHGHGNGH